MNIVLLVLITILSTSFSVFLIYLYVKNAGSKIDYLKASELSQSENYNEAEAYYKISLQKTNSNDYVHLSSLMGLQNIYFKTNRLNESLEYLNLAIELSEKNIKWKQINSRLKKLKEKHFS